MRCDDYNDNHALAHSGCAWSTDGKKCLGEALGGLTDGKRCLGEVLGGLAAQMCCK